MKILLIGPFGQGLLAESYALALKKNGHEIFRFDSDQAYFKAAFYAGNRWLRRVFRRELWDRLNLKTLQVVRGIRPELVLAFKAVFLNEETIRRIREEEVIPIANYYPDDPYIGVPLDPRKTSAQRKDLVKCLKEYTRVFIWKKELVHQLESDGVCASYLPFGADPEGFHPLASAKCSECSGSHEVVFVGQHNPRRENQIAEITNYETALFGHGWSRARRRFAGRHLIHQRSVFGLACAALYSSAKISLNIVNEWNIPGHNMRTFEIPASGGVMVSSYTDEQNEFFPEGEGAFYYRCAGELDGIIERLLKENKTREKVRRNALAIARDHDYRFRAEEMVAQLI